MKIGVISDTHLTFVDNRFAELTRRYFSDVDVIIHAGDMVDESVLTFLSAWRLLAVLGNMDRGVLADTLPQKRTEQLGGKRIGITHGWGSPGQLPGRVREEFRSDPVDCIVFGHSHAPLVSTDHGVLMFNPGSPTDKRFAEKNTLGFLTITENGITGEIQEI
ncbi:MAG: metallophosphoesterase family protein [Deltaproteobacteria bacterium]|nr:metallophosphoesterase family protein [Candidatus Zymogenaceae bacterium]